MPEPFTAEIRVERQQIVCMAELQGDPVPWARAGRAPRSGKHYTPARYLEHRTALAWALQHGRKGRAALVVDLGVFVTFYRRTRRHVDIDNLLKAVLDAGIGVIWADDSQITLAVVRVVIDPEVPRTEVVAFRREQPSSPLPSLERSGYDRRAQRPTGKVGRNMEDQTEQTDQPVEPEQPIVEPDQGQHGRPDTPPGKEGEQPGNRPDTPPGQEPDAEPKGDEADTSDTSDD